MVNRFVAAAAAGLALAGGIAAVVTAGSAASLASPVRGSVRGAAARLTGPPGGPVPAGFEPASVTFVSASDGWVLGTTKTCAHRPCTSVLRTRNGGRSWVGIPAPKYRLAADPLSTGLDRLRFASTANGFAFGSQLWVTHNGGSSWRRVRQVPGYITDLETSAGVVYAASERGGKVAIYKSPAGRNSWHRVSSLPRLSSGGGLGSITLHGTAAWIILGNRLYSSQTGSSFVRDHVTCPAGWGMDDTAAASAKRIALLCSGEPGLGSTAKRVYTSTHGGRHFRAAGRPSPGGDGGVLAAPTSRHLFIATASGATWLYASTDGGRHWHDNLTLDDGGLGWNDFGFTTASQGVAVEGLPSDGSHLWLTRNAGRTWHKVAF